jgi:hypothetical protein
MMTDLVEFFKQATAEALQDVHNIMASIGGVKKKPSPIMSLSPELMEDASIPTLAEEIADALKQEILAIIFANALKQAREIPFKYVIDEIIVGFTRENIDHINEIYKRLINEANSLSVTSIIVISPVLFTLFSCFPKEFFTKHEDNEGKLNYPRSVGHLGGHEVLIDMYADYSQPLAILAEGWLSYNPLGSIVVEEVETGEQEENGFKLHSHVNPEINPKFIKTVGVPQFFLTQF